MAEEQTLPEAGTEELPQALSEAEGQTEQPQEAAAGGSSKGYVLSKDSTVSSVEVDDKVVTAHGDPVDLTEDQYKRASAIDGVELVERKETNS